MVQPIPFPEADPAEFWKIWLDWQGRASQEELCQVEATLESLCSQEIMPLAKAMRMAIKDPEMCRMLPDTLVQRLHAVDWPKPRQPHEREPEPHHA